MELASSFLVRLSYNFYIAGTQRRLSTIVGDGWMLLIVERDDSWRVTFDKATSGSRLSARAVRVKIQTYSINNLEHQNVIDPLLSVASVGMETCPP